ncbi:MAG: HEPN domain-containing protein [Candidatus Binatus sp.]|uniref:HEPN domain-containing protein n=1 Tax=Candidatus Binatus sp. TaxID=2811406 RepID=UPI00272754D2|nr:HEPN domain-containing protein [Candidatus Binatus sp.]MDO8431871.1 HEPN domain-containing protein [Candidatus Binatus sp.]
MDYRDRILTEFQELLQESNQIIQNGGWNGSVQWERWPARDHYIRIRTRSLNLIGKSCGTQSDHFKALLSIATEDHSGEKSYLFPQCKGILEAARDDFQRNLLMDLKALVEAEVLGDVLEQAETLFSHGYLNPAASLAGAVLEDGLRRLCEQKGITNPSSTKIDSLNSELAKARVYEKLIQKRITAIADIRNNADHGHFDKFKKEDVDDMLKWVRRFLADYLK